ncbi:TPA: hypothetical protein RJ963_004690 [Enterobacter hormaechei]|uniref:hypothetical protein n=1 Tax=Enterobacter hormaechei TaxID=158836 RepID=UPI00285A6862|nr:hypothetical protein [Klebsiella pneumoniae]HDV8269942.1 hypothetical protein [Enterobacter hormaechei]
MKKQNTQYSTFTSYLSKTNKNVDMYRIYNPLNENLNIFGFRYDINFYDSYFKRHFITRRNFLTIFSIICFKLSNERFLGNKEIYMQEKKYFVKASIILFKFKIKDLSSDFDKLNISFRGGNVIFISQFGRKEEISYFTLSRIAGDIFDINDYSINNENIKKLIAA